MTYKEEPPSSHSDNIIYVNFPAVVRARALKEQSEHHQALCEVKEESIFIGGAHSNWSQVLHNQDLGVVLTPPTGELELNAAVDAYAVIEPKASQYILRALATFPPIKVNQVRINVHSSQLRELQLRDGDLIEIGSLVFQVRVVTAAGVQSKLVLCCSQQKGSVALVRNEAQTQTGCQSMLWKLLARFSWLPSDDHKHTDE